LGPVGLVATCRQFLLDSQMDQQRFMVLADGIRLLGQVGEPETRVSAYTVIGHQKPDHFSGQRDAVFGKRSKRTKQRAGRLCETTKRERRWTHSTQCVPSSTSPTPCYEKQAQGPWLYRRCTQIRYRCLRHHMRPRKKDCQGSRWSRRITGHPGRHIIANF
jgi:hypothetical protein